MGLFDRFKQKQPAPPPPKAQAPAKTPPKSAPAKSGGDKPAASSGGTSYSAAVCGDGIGVASFEKLSAKSAGYTGDNAVAEWRKAVIASLKAAKEGEYRVPMTKGADSEVTADQAKEFHAVADAFSEKGASPWDSPDDMESLLDGKIKGLEGFGGTGSGYKAHKQPMWGYLKSKKLAYEAHWQHQTAASWVNNGKTMYADGAEIPYFVVKGSDARSIGTFAKVSVPGKPDKVVYARLLEKGPALGEVSLAVWKGLGYPNTTPVGAPVDNLNIEVMDGSGGYSSDYSKGYLNYDEIQRAGKLIDEKKATSIRTRDELLEIEKKEAAKNGTAPKPAEKAAAETPPAAQQASGQQLEKGFQVVAIGSNMRYVGHACEDCVHTGGGFVAEGSSSVFVGQYPFARIGDATSDGLAVVSGDETVFVGGTPTAGRLV